MPDPGYAGLTFFCSAGRVPSRADQLTPKPTKHEARKRRASERHAVGCHKELASGLTSTRRGSLTPDDAAPRKRFQWELLLHVHIERSIPGGFAQFLDLPRRSPPPEATR